MITLKLFNEFNGSLNDYRFKYNGDKIIEFSKQPPKDRAVPFPVDNDPFPDVRSNNAPTSVIRFDKVVNIEGGPCIFINKNDNNHYRITPDKWKKNNNNEYEHLVTIDNIQVGLLTYNKTKCSFTMHVNSSHFKEAQSILERHPFKAPSSDPIYFY